MIKRDYLKEHVRMEVGDGRCCRVWMDLSLQGGSIFQQLGKRVIYDVASRRDARLADFIDLDREWRWPRVSMNLIDI